MPLTVFPIELPAKNPFLDVDKCVYEAFVATQGIGIEKAYQGFCLDPPHFLFSRDPTPLVTFVKDSPILTVETVPCHSSGKRQGELMDRTHVADPTNIASFGQEPGKFYVVPIGYRGGERRPVIFEKLEGTSPLCIGDGVRA